MAQHLAPAAERMADLVSESGSPWLDIGSGSGNGLVASQTHGRWSVGLDLAIGQLRSAQSVVALPQVQGDAGSLPFGEESFEVVTSNFALIFAPDVGAVVAQAYRCLKPGGRFAFTAWTPDGWPNPARQILGRYLPPVLGVVLDGEPLPKASGTGGFPVELGEPDNVLKLLSEAGLVDIVIREGFLRWTFADPEDALETLTAAAGGLRTLREQLVAAGNWDLARAELLAELITRIETDQQGAHIDDRYLLVVASKPK